MPNTFEDFLYYLEMGEDEDWGFNPQWQAIAKDNPVFDTYANKYPNDATYLLYVSRMMLKKMPEILTHALEHNKRVIFYAPTQLHEEAIHYPYYKAPDREPFWHLFVDPEAKEVPLKDTVFGTPLTPAQQYNLEEKAWKASGKMNVIDSIPSYLKKYPEEQLHLMQMLEFLDDLGIGLLTDYILDYVLYKDKKIRFRFDPDRGKVGMYVYDVFEVTSSFWKPTFVVTVNR